MVLLLPAVPALAFAQAQTSPSSASAPGSASAISCERFYPPAAEQDKAEGNTILSVHLLPDGSVKNPHVIESSGHANLDQAAITRVAGTRLAPKTQNGTPLELDEPVEVAWRISSFVNSPVHAGAPNICSNFYYPLSAIRNRAEGDVLISFVVAADGTVKNIDVKQSSGHSDLDQAAIKCVSQFRYRPLIQNGTPVEFDNETAVRWRLR
jgi:TonB family protein